MKNQVVVIHGGETFDSYEEYLVFLRGYSVRPEKLWSKSWRDTMGESLGVGFDVVNPEMPNRLNAKYIEWKIFFEKLISLFEEKVVFVGHSLGGLFLAKYLSENSYPKKILATFLVAACFDDIGRDYSLADFNLSKNLEKFTAQGGKIFIYHSTDDPLVDLQDSYKYQKALPGAVLKIFEGRGHFSEEKFPELADEIKKVFE